MTLEWQENLASFIESYASNFEELGLFEKKKYLSVGYLFTPSISIRNESFKTLEAQPLVYK